MPAHGPGANSFTLINAAKGGKLPLLLGAWRGSGLSAQKIADKLAVDGFEVSAETVRRWLHDLDIMAA